MSQRKFLVNGVIRGAAFGPSPVPVTTIATLEPGEAFDESTVLALQHMLLEQNPGAEVARVLGFEQLESVAPVTEIYVAAPLLSDAEKKVFEQMFGIQGIDQGLTDLDNVSYPIPGWPGEDLKFNSGCLLPPVDCPLLIELEPGVVIRASRPTFAESKGDQLVFQTEHGLTVIGRPRWTYP